MDYDLCVIGGGINGVGIARDAAGRGLSVLLVEAQDLASATSSASTKLVHGGLRYLEHYEFRLVKESLHERRTLLDAAPHIIWPLQFVLPHDDKLRPFWMIKTGMFLYDRLAGRKKIKKSKALDFATDSLADPLQDKYDRGFSYYDCWAEDSRLVTLNAVDAKERGAEIMTRTACLFLEPTREKDGWQIFLQNTESQDEFQVTAKTVVNAAGPWARSMLDGAQLVEKEGGDKNFVPNVRLVKGSHIVVPKIYNGDHCYILQQPDERIVFTIPYEKKYTLIGTTDVPYEGNASEVQIDQDEITYLCDAVNHSLKKQISADDVVWTYSGVRSLVDDGQKNSSKVTRDYKLYMDERFGPPILSVFGGKLTTYRALGEEVMDRLSTFFPDKPMLPWTDKATLPGGDILKGDFKGFLQKQGARYTFLPEGLLYRYARAYGTRIEQLLESIHKMSDMGEHYGDGVYEKEIQYLINHEFAKTAEDILWRRSKLGLHISDETRDSINAAVPKLINHDVEEEDDAAA